MVQQLYNLNNQHKIFAKDYMFVKKKINTEANVELSKDFLAGLPYKYAGGKRGKFRLLTKNQRLAFDLQLLEQKIS